MKEKIVDISKVGKTITKEELKGFPNLVSKGREQFISKVKAMSVQECLSRIIEIGTDYSGYKYPNDLMDLIDDMIAYANRASAILRNPEKTVVAHCEDYDVVKIAGEYYVESNNALNGLRVSSGKKKVYEKEIKKYLRIINSYKEVGV